MYVLFSFSFSFDLSLWWPLLLPTKLMLRFSELPTSPNNACTPTREDVSDSVINT